MKLLAFLFLFAAGLSGVSVAQDVPAKEFTVSLSTETLVVRAGESQTLTVTLNKSKSFSKAKAEFGVTSGLPQGITVAFDPAAGLESASQATIVVAKHTAPGHYTLALGATLFGKKKAALVKVEVTGGALTKNGLGQPLE
ncbi:MAG: hypothetical protein MUC38_14950 [Cyclobacteriaceae bacterium]|jgi:phage gp45-like|nr:hypothetical protein [Cyclobacteriaceae bacterium]